MTGWIAVVALTGAAFLLAALLLRLPREGWMLFAAALVFGLAGYAWQGSPDQPSAPKAIESKAESSGQTMVVARKQLFDPVSPKPGYLVTSDAFALRGQFDDAAGLLRRGLLENPDHLEGWLALGIALVGHADGVVTPAARESFDRATSVDPDHPGPDFFLGSAYLRSGDVLEAREVWAGLLVRAPEDAQWRPDLERRVNALDQMIADAPMLQGR